jgi:phage-related protein
MTTYVFDQLSAVPAVGYGLRLLHSTYAGKCINVRRSSDNTATDIGFVNGALDTASLLTFVGSGSGYVTTWYNQGSVGATANLTQTTAGYQPRIVNAGALETQNGIAAMNFGGSQSAGTCFFNLPAAAAPPAGAPAFSVNLVASYTVTTNGVLLAVFGSNPYAGPSFAANTGALSVWNGSSAFSTTFTPVAGTSFISTTNFGATTTAYVNSTSVGSNTNSYTLANVAVQLGQDVSSGYWYGTVQEFIVPFADLSPADQSTLEQSQGSYYLIYTQAVITAALGSFYRASTGTYIAQNGTMQIAGVNVPRIDWSTGSAELLIEPAATNTVINSTTSPASGYVWINSGAATLAVSTDVPPLLAGANVYKSTTVNATNMYLFITDSNGMPVGFTCTTSCWVWLPPGWNPTYTLGIAQDGSLNPFNFVYANPNLTGQWQRISTSGYQNYTNPYVIVSGYLTATDVRSNVPVGTVFYVTCSQSEVGSAPTSFIPTAGSDVTRAADIAYKTTAVAASATATAVANAAQQFSSFSRASTATYIDVNGVMQTAPVNALRTNYTNVIPNLSALSHAIIGYTETATTPIAISGSAISFTSSTPGGDCWMGYDDGIHVYQQVTGDFVATAQAAISTGGPTWTKLGLMVRDSMVSNGCTSVLADMLVTTGAGFAAQWADFKSGLHAPDQNINGYALGATNFVKIQRTGNVLALSHSTDGVTWILNANVIIPGFVPALYVSAVLIANGTASTGTITNFQIAQGELLIEAAATNLLTNSACDTNSGWGLGGNTIRVGLTAGLDGGNTAVVYTGTPSSPGDQFAEFPVTLVAGATYTASVWARFVSGTPPSYGKLLNINNGSYYPITSITSNWQRFSLTFVAGAADGSSVNNNFFYVASDWGPGADIAVWGAQIEAAGVSTSYIPTTSGPVTRAADLAVVKPSTSTPKAFAVTTPLFSFVPPFPPLAPVEDMVQPRRLGVRFGDGYSQMAIDGLNPELSSVALTFEPLTVSQYQGIENFLESQQGTPFYYTLPTDGVLRQWVASDWTPSRQGTYYSLQLNLVQTFS